ncbi:MAG: hypothetical protein M3Z10_01745 [Gemmatimonadota bacterium]|nr:hypothetical protein [Gemmatimonadota bacterium]
MSSEQSDQGPRAFTEAQQLLKDTLEQACGADVTGADTGQLIRLEEILAIADGAAKQAISIKRRIRHDRERAPRRDSDAEGHRRFRDAAGVVWDVRAIYPSATPGRTRLPEPFESGWLAFESPKEKRRLSPIPGDWMTRADEELRLLCQAAHVVAPRLPEGESIAEEHPS